jgi:hypothetical protein
MPICPSCHVVSARDDRCASCGGDVVIDGRYVVDAALAGDRTHDAVDGIGGLFVGRDRRDGSRVLVRLAGDDRARLTREATISRGLTHGQLPRLRHSDANATVWALPAGRVVDDALAAGRRSDNAGLRRVLTSLLTVLADLEALGPPVHLLGVHAGNVFVNDHDAVTVVDLARATDTAADVVAKDAVAVRAGMAPQKPFERPAQVDLYAVGVLALSLATRLQPLELPRDKAGRVDVGAGVVDDALRGFLLSLLRGGFFTKAEALAALRRLDAPKQTSSAAPFLLAAAALGVVALVGLGVMFAQHPTPPPPPEGPFLSVSVDPHDAIVSIDGQSFPPHDSRARARGAVHVLAAVTPGRHRVSAQRPGYVEQELEVVVEGNASVHIALVRVTEPVPPDPPRPPRPPVVPEPPKPPVTPQAPDPPPLPPPSADDALLRAIEAAVRAQREEIEACPDDGSDRIKMHLTLKGGRGALTPIARGDVDAVRCVVDAAAVAAWPQTPHQGVEADVWVWRRPAFKVAAY